MYSLHIVKRLLCDFALGLQMISLLKNGIWSDKSSRGIPRKCLKRFESREVSLRVRHCKHISITMIINVGHLGRCVSDVLKMDVHQSWVNVSRTAHRIHSVTVPLDLSEWMMSIGVIHKLLRKLASFVFFFIASTLWAHFCREVCITRFAYAPMYC